MTNNQGVTKKNYALENFRLSDNKLVSLGWAKKATGLEVRHKTNFTLRQDVLKRAKVASRLMGIKLSELYNLALIGHLAAIEEPIKQLQDLTKDLNMFPTLEMDLDVWNTKVDLDKKRIDELYPP